MTTSEITASLRPWFKQLLAKSDHPIGLVLLDIDESPDPLVSVFASLLHEETQRTQQALCALDEPFYLAQTPQHALRQG
jgi:hypothetical protein